MARVMKKIGIFISIFVFLGTAQLVFADAGYENCKLANPEKIMNEFEAGWGKVKVIVNLVEPSDIRATVRWKSKASLKEFHEKVSAIQQPVMSALGANEFKLRHRFENQAGFSGEITLDGLEKLIDDSRVDSIEPVIILEPHLAQGVPLMNAGTYRSTYNGQGVSIAICDTGVDYTHPKLGGGGFPNSKVIGGYDTGDNDSNPFPTTPFDPHGTCCAGIVAGDLGNVNDYIGGVAHSAKIYALKTKKSSGDITTATLAGAWDWCTSHKN